MSEIKYGISKILSPNDTGETGSHQVGMYIPKDKNVLSFFPQLIKDKKNPSVEIIFRDDHDNRWNFRFIYYNNSFFGGTRNEYRLTKMSGFIRENDLKPGEELILWKDNLNQYSITFYREKSQVFDENGVLRLGTQWRAIKI